MIDSNFEINSVETFSGGAIGQCAATQFVFDQQTKLTITHKGGDGWIGDWIKIHSNGKEATCQLNGVVMKESEKHMSNRYDVFTTVCDVTEGELFQYPQSGSDRNGSRFYF